MMRDRQKVRLLVETLEEVRNWIDAMSDTHNFGVDDIFAKIDDTLDKVEPIAERKPQNRKGNLKNA